MPFPRGIETVVRTTQKGALGPLVCMKDTFFLKETRAQDKMYILVGTLLGLYILLPLSTSTGSSYKQHICRRKMLENYATNKLQGTVDDSVVRLNVVVEWFTLLLCIQEIQGAILGPGDRVC
jgi:hypothetical protein